MEEDRPEDCLGVLPSSSGACGGGCGRQGRGRLREEERLEKGRGGERTGGGGSGIVYCGEGAAMGTVRGVRAVRTVETVRQILATMTMEVLFFRRRLSESFMQSRGPAKSFTLERIGL